MRDESPRKITRRSRPSWRAPREGLMLILGGRTFRSAAPVALIVGTVLSAVNEGAVLAGSQVTTTIVIRIAVNYTVPYLVASVGYLMACRTRQDTDANDHAN